MTLLAATLATELKKLTLYSEEPLAIAAWAEAFGKYFEGAQSNLVPIVPLALEAAVTAFLGAGTGMATDAATALTAAITAFWGAIVPATAWPTTTVITPPPGLAALTNTLKGVFLSNTNSSLSKDVSMTLIANAIHAAQAGGTAAWPLPTPGVQPIT
jgi:hypothetical protein